MGLAPYGRPDAVKPMMEMRNGELHVPPWGVEFDRPWLMDGDWEKNPAVPHWEDMARRVQDDSERILLERAIWLRTTTGARNLCMAGGVALNCVANGRIVREAGFDNVWIQPAAGDDGIAIGCAYYGHLAIQGNPRSFVMKHAYLGASYSDEQVRAAANKRLVRVQAIIKVSKTFARTRPSCCRRVTCSAGFKGGPSLGHALSAAAVSWLIHAAPK
jgi:carbamoyltransferase